MKFLCCISIFLALVTGGLWAAPEGVNGQWVTPGGAVVSVYPCGEHKVCAKLIRPLHPTGKDTKNPEESLRSHPLCGLEIGREFSLTDPSHAKDGKIYDPDSGKTYSATMTANGSELKLHGYIGISMFGRTEVWKRSQQDVAACTP